MSGINENNETNADNAADNAADTVDNGDDESEIIIINIPDQMEIKNNNKFLLSGLKKYQKINKLDQLITEQSVCSICLCSYQSGEYKRTLNCNHIFHKKCVDKWLLKSNKMDCPICRMSHIPLTGTGIENINRDELDLLTTILVNLESLLEQTF